MSESNQPLDAISKAVERKVRHAGFRLTLARFFARLIWCVTGTLAAVCGLVILEKFGIVSRIPLEWAILGSLSAGVALAAIISVLKRVPKQTAAFEVDKACGLQERVGTLYSLDPEVLNSPIGQALKQDVETQLATLDVSESIPVKPPRYGWMPMLPLTAAILIYFFVGPMTGTSKQAEAKPPTVAEMKRAAEATKVLEKKIADQKKMAEENKLSTDLKELVTKIDSAVKEISKQKDLTPKETVLKLNDLAKQLEEKRKSMDEVDALKRQLNKLQAGQQNETQKLAQSLKQGDFKEAMKQLEQLNKKLSDSKVSPEQKKELAKQLEKLKKDIDNLAKLGQKADQIKKSKLPEGEKKAQLKKLEEEAKKLSSLKKLADQLQKCADCQNGQQPGQMNKEMQEMAMKEAQNLLDQLDKSDMASQTIEEMIRELDNARKGCCNGEGEGNNPGMGDMPGGNNQGDNAKNRGRAAGYRDEKETATKSKEQQSSSQANKGRIQIVGRAESKNTRGETVLDAKTAIAEAARGANDAVTRQKVPIDYQEHTRDYFNKMNEQE